MDDWKRGVIFGAVISFLSGMVIYSVSAVLLSSSYKKEAIEHGAARYHPTTGEFEWIDRAETQ